MTLSSLRRRFGCSIFATIIATTLVAYVLIIRSPLDTRSLPFSLGDFSSPRVTLRQGTYIGNELVKEGHPQMLEQFLGIPYGQFTGGERRFKEPLPVEASKKTFRAIDHGNRCPAGFMDGAGENCLNLNIYRPKHLPGNARLPVLVHIYGGSFNFGFDRTRGIPDMIAWSTEPFIGITFNYRVGAFGFLNPEFIAADSPVNTGLKDQALLLAWVQENIAAFGGDPEDVTLMGNSAGAHSIGHHVMHNPSESPNFHKVIIESGGSTARAVYTPLNPIHVEQFQKFVAEVGLEHVGSDHILEALRQLPAQQVMNASLTLFKNYNPSMRWPFQPVIDGPSGFIAQSPISAWEQGKFHRVRILTGFNTDEGAMFAPMETTGSRFTSFFETLLPSLSQDDLHLLDDIYPDPLVHPDSKYREDRPDIESQFKRTAAAYGHFAYVCPVRQAAQFASANDVPVYLYHFAVNTSVKGGADHGSHSSFPTFGSDVASRSDTLKEVAGSMHAYWTSFIVSGDPNSVRGRWPERPKWPLYTESEAIGQLLMFGEGNDEMAGGGHRGVVSSVKNDDWAREECMYWSNRSVLFEL